MSSKVVEVKGMGRFCDQICPICLAARGKSPWLKSVVKFAYNYFCGRPAKALKIPSPCTSREKQTGKKPWE